MTFNRKAALVAVPVCLLAFGLFLLAPKGRPQAAPSQPQSTKAPIPTAEATRRVTVLPRTKPAPTAAQEPPSEFSLEELHSAVQVFQAALNTNLEALTTKADACVPPAPVKLEGDRGSLTSNATFELMFGESGLSEAQLVEVDGTLHFDDEVLACITDVVWDIDWPGVPSGQAPTITVPLRTAATISMSPEELEMLKEKLGTEGEIRVKVNR